MDRDRFLRGEVDRWRDRDRILRGEVDRWKDRDGILRGEVESILSLNFEVGRNIAHYFFTFILLGKSVKNKFLFSMTA